jgi:hypothetical protein
MPAPARDDLPVKFALKARVSREDQDQIQTAASPRAPALAANDNPRWWAIAASTRPRLDDE